jgi:hypothetical protein
MAYFLGCDVSKRKLDLCFIDEIGIEQWADQVMNELTVIAEFLLTVTGNYLGVICVVEATSSYHIAFAETTNAVGLRCLVFNPILTRSRLELRYEATKLTRPMLSWWHDWDCVVKVGHMCPKCTGLQSTSFGVDGVSVNWLER